jgi:tetratricopeptide (TPR) repeat protein
VEWLARLALANIRFRQEPEGAAETAFREGRAAVAAREAAGDHEVLARAWSLIAEGHNMRSEPVEQARAAERGAAHARAAGDLALEVDLVVHTAPPMIYGPVPVEECVRYVDGVLERLGHVPAVHAFALHVLGHVRARLGEFEGAREAIEEWRSGFRELGQETLYGITAACVWDVCSWAGDWAGGERALRESYELAERIGERTFRSTMAGYLGEAVYRQGRIDEAERLSEVSEELGARDDRLNEAVWRALRAKVCAARGDFEPALALAREAVEIAAGTDYFEHAADMCLALAEVERAAGNADGSAAAARDALARYEQKGNLVGARRARAMLAR